MFNTELFIDEIKLRPCIWDSASEAFKDRELKKRKWTELCRMFHPEFDKLTSKQKDEMCKGLQSKWRNIKDAYRKFWRSTKTKSGRTRKPVTKYVFSAQLSFLDKIFETVRSEASPNVEVNSLHGNSQDGSIIGAEEENETDSEVEKRTYTERSSTPRRRTQRTEEKIENYIDSFQATKTPRLEEESDDMAFFKSLIPVLKPLPLQEKLKFRMDVLKIAMEYSGGMRERADPLNPRREPPHDQ